MVSEIIEKLRKRGRSKSNQLKKKTVSSKMNREIFTRRFAEINNDISLYCGEIEMVSEENPKSSISMSKSVIKKKNRSKLTNTTGYT